MKITRKRLKEILKEEVTAVLENRDSEYEPTDPRDIKLTPAERDHAIELGYIDPHDPAATNASGAAQYKADKAAGEFRRDEGAGQSDPWASVHKQNPFVDPDEYQATREKADQDARDEASVARAVPYSKKGQEEREAKPIALGIDEECGEKAGSGVEESEEIYEQPNQ